MKNHWLDKKEFIETNEMWATYGSSIPNHNYDIAFQTKEGDTMLLITPEKFVVRGVEVPQDEGEAKKVYDALRDFLWGAKYAN